MNVAVIAVAYNRIDSLSRLLSSLNTAYYPNGTNVSLIISVDKSKTDLVEKYADGFIWNHGSKTVDKHATNLGLRAHMMSLGKWFHIYDAIVVLEDDIVVSPNYYFYTLQAVEQYHNNNSIAGISLYSIAFNYHKGVPFSPMKNEYDTYFMNCAMSWGEVWMRESWQQFYDWYLKHQEFPVLPHLPRSICSWNDKSWLKFHTRYCIEENKYFVHPYVSLSTNFGDAGEHSDGGANTLYQVVVQTGRKEHYKMPATVSDAIVYDGFFENKALYRLLSLTSDELCLDLQGEWDNRLKRKYWLTTRVQDYKIVHSYGLNYRPIDFNVILDNAGNNIFLYDTTIYEKNPIKNNKSIKLYFYRISNMFFFVKKYGFLNLFRDSIIAIVRRVFKK